MVPKSGIKGVPMMMWLHPRGSGEMLPLIVLHRKSTNPVGITEDEEGWQAQHWKYPVHVYRSQVCRDCSDKNSAARNFHSVTS